MEDTEDFHELLAFLDDTPDPPLTLDGVPDVLLTLEDTSTSLLTLEDASNRLLTLDEPVAVAPSLPLTKPTAPDSRLVTKSSVIVLKNALTSLSMCSEISPLQEPSVAMLTNQLTRLRTKRSLEWIAAKECALNERRQRQRAEAECCALREAVYAQRRFLNGLWSVFSGIPRLALGLDLCRYLHRHKRLARNRNSRWGEFDAEAHSAWMRSAIDVLCHETETLSLSGEDNLVLDPTPLIYGETTDTGDCYTTNSISLYSVDSSDLSAVVRATCVAAHDVATICAFGHPLVVLSDIVDVDASIANNTLYRVTAVKHLCGDFNEDISVETHVLTSYKILDDYAIVVWDFVDIDELHPTSDTTNVAREVTGACLIRREWCQDGIERTVFRSLATKKFRFLNQESANKLRRLFACLTHPTESARGNEMLFRKIILDQLAMEKAIYAHTQARRHSSKRKASLLDL